MQLSDKAKELVINKYGKDHEKRLKHVFGVAKMAEYLADKYGVDKEKALTAAYMHDFAKYDDPTEAIGILDEKDIEECEKYPFLYHAYLSAEAYLKYLGTDMDVYNAIRYHVFGRPHMSLLEAIIMIADYTEENREYDTCIECRKILLDGEFNKAIYKSLEELIIDNLGRVKASNIIVYDAKERSPFYDKIVIASVDSVRQCSAVIRYLIDDLAIHNYKIRSVEGKDTAWVLVDCFDIIVSIFQKEERDHYDIDKVYMDYPKKLIEE